MPQAHTSRWDLPTLLRDIPGRKEFARTLAPFTSMRVGGPADVLVRIETVHALQALQAVAKAHAIPLFILGGGSNLLIRDGGIRGIVVLLRGTFRSYGVQLCQPPGDPVVAHAQVGVAYPLSRLALQLARQGWSGLEFAYGIPGTLGGALVMNAGTHLGDMSQVLVQARLLLCNGQMQELPLAALGLRYRGSSYPSGSVLLGATLRLQQGERTHIEATMHASYARRQRTQPLSQPNAGSIFKNPPGMAAGRLIEDLGCKGLQRGGAMISPVHANFIVNVGGATAADVQALMAHIQERVQAAYQVLLEPEVHVVGEEA
ncbi:MAG: UDP-N-acetylmuramate dehydrogenase [Candidatus Tectomicrobia bacterium]|uniref:UDP-N-acetylenolpyruvoylglucosamine reductase n=1 Tax=Tectimicrobiota bacterium TaxID=2528274 RepID=A0A937W1E2_UNCTE|nr:UDP-N-acetylmuramate dehydrogenase [Candidatus Tectomicrobia bacterium]